MNIELMDTIEARVAKHAALADPARLRIVDLLTLGDVSSTNVQQLLGMPSNLIAHHLRVLDDAGLITRHRSEADKRRSYIRLAVGALDGLMPSATRVAHRVVFVCTGNTARSQLAAALWRRASEIPVASAGTRPAAQIADGARLVADRHGYDLGEGTPAPLEDIVLPDDFIVTVCDMARESLGDALGLHWSVPDPVSRGTEAAFEDAFADLEHRVFDLAPHLRGA